MLGGQAGAPADDDHVPWSRPPDVATVTTVIRPDRDQAVTAVIRPDREQAGHGTGGSWASP